jgi:hypothetical protein
MGDYAFEYCQKLRVLKLSKGTSTLNSFAFVSCGGIKRIEIPEGVTDIADRVFLMCSNVRSVTLSNTVSRIGYMGFSDLSYLQELTIPASVTYLDKCAFGYAPRLRSVTFLGNAPEMAATAFSGITATCYYPAGNATWTNSKKQNYGGTLTWVPMCADATPTAKSFSLSFEDEIKVNFYFTVNDISGLSQHGMLVFNTDTAEPSLSTASRVYSQCPYNSETGLFMAQTDGIDAKRLGDTCYYAAYAKSVEAPYLYTQTYAYSPKKYATNMLTKSTTSEKQKALCVAMLNYGTAAQEYFGYKTDDLMNASLTAEQQAMVAQYDASLFTGAVPADSSKIGSFARTETCFSSRKASVSFDSAFSLNYYFTPDNTVDGNVDFYYWTKADYDAADVLCADNATGKVTMIKQNDGSYYAEIEGIAPKNLDDTYYVAGVYTSDAQVYCSGVVSYSVSQYCLKAASGTGPMKDLAQKALMYGYYADAFFNS